MGMPDPPEGFWEETLNLLRLERELWDAGVDTPEWWPRAEQQTD